MRRTIRRLFLVLTIALVTAPVCFFTTRAEADGRVPGHVLVCLKTGVDANQFASQFGSSVLSTLHDTTVSLKQPKKVSISDFLKRLKADSRVNWAEPDTFLFSGIQKHLAQQYHYAFDTGHDRSTYVDQFAFQQVHLGEAHQIATGAGIIVAVIDTGVDFTHPDLQGHLLPGYNVLKPGTLPQEVADGVTNAGMGHGTMIAGLIAQLAPGASILPVRVLNADGVGTLEDIAKGIDFAVSQGAKVINMSFGGSDRMNTLDDSLNHAEQSGAILVSSAGNSGQNMVQFPAASHGCIAVAAIDSNDIKADFSAYGSFVTVSAPGVGIRSTYFDGGYASWSGTSFSAPIVAAEAALVFSVNARVSNSDVKNAIQSTAVSIDKLNPQYSGRLGKGIIDIEAAVKSIH